LRGGHDSKPVDSTSQRHVDRSRLQTDTRADRGALVGRAARSLYIRLGWRVLARGMR
jgi:hypothetical protein